MADAIRFYLDENIPVVIAEQLELRGIQVYTVQVLDVLSDSDMNHLIRATQMVCMLCTFDNDFLRIARSGIDHAGIVKGVQVRHTIGHWVKRLMWLHSNYTAEDMRNHIEFL